MYYPRHPGRGASLLGSIAIGTSLTLATSLPSAAGDVGMAAPLAAAPTASAPFYPPDNMPPAADQTWHLTMIGADAAYSRGYTGAGVVVTVGDTGFDIYHPSLAGKLDLSRALTTLQVYGEDGNIRNVDIQGPSDGHGSHVAGIIAGRNDPSLSASHGVAYDATIVPIRTIFDEEASKAGRVRYIVNSPLTDALNYFTSLSDSWIYSASYGPAIDPKTPPLNIWPVSPYSADEAHAAYEAVAAGKIIVVANGNDRGRHKVAGLNPNGMALYPFIRPEHEQTGVYYDFGAGLDYSSLLGQSGLIIGVMSVGRDKTPAYYSNFCGVAASWCVAAPGGDQSSGREGGVFSTVPRSLYDFYQGTSMATPVVSGAIAVLMSAYPGYTTSDIARLLFSTTEDLGAAGIDLVYGQGLIRLDRAIDGPTTLAAGHTETVAADTTTYWSQPVAASGGFTKAGDGILTIAGRTTAPGDVTVASGTLAVDGTLSVSGTNHALLVQQPGTLAGMGVIQGNSLIAGTLSPGKMANVQDQIANGIISSASEISGNSAGMLTFQGNVTLAATATTQIDIDGQYLVPGGPNTYDRIQVSGTGHSFAANGTLTPVLTGTVGTPSHYIPPIGSHFGFIEAVDGAQVTGSFASLTQPASGLPGNSRLDLVYSPTLVTLNVTPASFANLSDATANRALPEGAVAAILDGVRTAPGVVPAGPAKSLFDALYGLNSESDYATTLRQLGAPGIPAVTSAAMSAIQGFVGSIADRQDALNGGLGDVQTATSQSIAFAYAGSSTTTSAETSAARAAFASLAPAAEPEPTGWSVWAQGFGRWSSVNDSGGLSGSVSRSGGFAVGADRALSADLSGGLAVGFARTSSTATGTSATSDSYTGALYATWTPGAAVIDMRAAMGQSRIQTTRELLLLPTPVHGSADGFGGNVAVEAGYRIPLGLATLKPFVGASWQGFWRDGYSETPQPFGLVFPSRYFEKVMTTVGAAVTTQRQFANGFILSPEVKLGYGHDWRDTTLVTEAALLDQPFLIEGAKPGRDAALVGLKLAGWTRDNFRLFVAYNGEFRSNATSHQFSGGARLTW